MCLATPCKIMEIKGKKALVKSGGHSHETDLSLIKNAKIGDYILIHADMAINKLPKEEAEKILEVINNTNHHHEKQ